MSRIVLALLAFILLVPTSQAQTAEDLFQQAVRVERLSGNTEAAIALYEQIVEEHPGNPEITAKALLRLGKAYEASGTAGAASAYETIISEFGQFANEKREAETRLADLRRSGLPNISDDAQEIRKLTTVSNLDWWGGALSPDGRYMLGSTWRQKTEDEVGGDGGKGGVLMQDVVTGQEHFVDFDPGQGGGWAQFVRMSPSGKHIAAGWDVGLENDLVRVANLEDGSVRDVFDGNTYWESEGFEGSPRGNTAALDWSKDGRYLLVHTSLVPIGNATEQRLVLVDVENGETSTVAHTKDLPDLAWEISCLSEDSRFAFAEFNKKRSDQADRITRFNVANAHAEIWRSSTVADIELIGCTWNPDRVLYSSTIAGVSTVFAADPGELDASKDQMITSIANSGSWGMAAKNGSIIAWDDDAPVLLWSMSLDPSEGVVSTAPVQRSTAWANSGNFSPSQNKIAWTDYDANRFVVYDADTDTSRDFELPRMNQRRYRAYGWSEDGQRILIYYGGVDPLERVLYEFDPETGEMVDSLSTYRAETEFGFQLDSQIIRFENQIVGPADDGCLHGLSWDNGTLTKLFCPELPENLVNGSVRVSPDQRQIAISYYTKDRTSTIKILNTETWEISTVFEEKATQGIYSSAKWLNSSELYYRWLPERNYQTRGMYILNLETGDSSSVLDDLFQRITPRGMYLSSDRAHLVVFGSPTVGDQPTQATITRLELE